MKQFDRNDILDVLTFVCIGALALFGFGYIATYDDRSKTRQMEIEKDYPPEYWLAKKAAEEASIKKHEIDVASRERLSLDKREREDKARQERTSFELNAPPEYWESKKVAEQEKTRRELNRMQSEMNKRQIEANKYIARHLF